MTLGEVNALTEVWNEDSKREDWRCAAIVCSILNCSGHSKEVFTPEKIMPWLREAAALPPAASPAQSPEEMRAFMERVTRQMGGKVHGKAN